MAKVYAKLIKLKQGFTLDMVPERWRAEVQALLEEED